jgi:hypothetical protein
MHAKYFQEPKGDTIWTTKKTKKSHEGVKPKSCPNYIKESIQHKIESKVHQVNKANVNEHKGSLKHTCSMTYLILRNRTKSQKEIAILPKRARFQQINQTLHSFYDGTLSTKKKRFVFQQ